MDETAPRRPAEILFGKIDDMRSRVAAAADACRKYLFSIQHEDGYWCGELEADTTLESDYILVHTLLGTAPPKPKEGLDGAPAAAGRIQKAANWILSHQNEDGGWGTYTGSPSSVTASVKAYFGLKLTGYSPDHPALAKARQKILAHFVFNVTCPQKLFRKGTLAQFAECPRKTHGYLLEGH